ncbi:hypothetical protein AGMMS49991_05850 [Spirochaetia bacterium]|nr:hypothetical protein AGMMS49991_05850 [Spirochaetia bacterium]
MGGGGGLKEDANELSIVAIARNEAPYISEWIEYHKLVGVEKFYIYDNKSDDNLKEVLNSYIEDGTVIYTYFPGDGKPGFTQQHLCYIDAIRNYKHQTRWLAIIDLDEFIVPVKDKTITDFLKDFTFYSQIIMRWIIYGSSGHKTKPDGLVIENYKNRADESDTRWTKVIVNPRSVMAPKTHACFVCGFTVDENKHIVKPEKFMDTNRPDLSMDKIRINHYYTKSLEEYLNKGKHGTLDLPRQYKRNADGFMYDDKNAVFDPIMDKYVEPVKAAIANQKKSPPQGAKLDSQISV